MGHLLGRGRLKPKEFGAVVGLMGFEHGVESMQEFAHDGDQACILNLPWASRC